MYRLETKKKHWTINYQGVAMKPSFDESCFTKLVFMCHLPTLGDQDCLYQAVKQLRQGARQERCPHHHSPCGLADFKHDLGMMDLGLVLLFFPNTASAAAAAQAAGCCELHNDQPMCCLQLFPRFMCSTNVFWFAKKAVCKIPFISLT